MTFQQIKDLMSRPLFLAVFLLTAAAMLAARIYRKRREFPMPAANEMTMPEFIRYWNNLRNSVHRSKVKGSIARAKPWPEPYPTLLEFDASLPPLSREMILKAIGPGEYVMKIKRTIERAAGRTETIELCCASGELAAEAGDPVMVPADTREKELRARLERRARKLAELPTGPAAGGPPEA